MRRLLPSHRCVVPGADRREERFDKIAVGWILREISRYDEAFVRQVIDENLPRFSGESFKNATKHFDRDTQGDYREMQRNAQ